MRRAANMVKNVKMIRSLFEGSDKIQWTQVRNLRRIYETKIFWYITRSFLRGSQSSADDLGEPN
jgi:hypothetical protein